MEKREGLPLRVLIVEDSDDDCALLLRELKRGGYEPTHHRVETEEALRAALARQEWDIVFADYTMPQFSGTQALALVRGAGLDIPFIFVSGTIGEDTAVAALKAGAQDYIMKGSYKRLLPAVDRELRDVAVKRERRRAEVERRRADARFRNILTMAADAVVAVDADQRITVFNHGAERIFGYRSEEVEGQLLDVLLPSRFVTPHRKLMHQFADSPQTARRVHERSEIYGRRKDGSEFPAEATISKLVEGGTTTFTVFLRDISERKRAEEELRLLQTITQAANEAGDVDAALTVTLTRVCETTGWGLAQAWVPGSDETVIECSPAWYCGNKEMEPLRTVSLELRFARGEGLPGRVWVCREAIWLPDVVAEATCPRAATAHKVGIQAALAVPVLADERVLAVLEFFLGDTHSEDERTVNLVRGVATQLGSVIQRKYVEERLQYLAHYDALTGLPNRVLFTDRLAQALHDAHRHQRVVAVAFLDLDRFKTINDSLGHGIGDQFLKAVAERLVACVREGDTVARLAGDEFTLILVDMGHEEDAAHVAQNILHTLSLPFRIAEHELYTGASIGITLYPSDNGDAEALLRNADVAMYRAKEYGGNGYEFYSPDMTARAQARLTLESALRHAVDHGELLLHYQPVVELQSGRIIGVEALVRWQHEQRGLVPPDEFIPVAEETGLIVRLGEWVLREACRTCQAYLPAPGEEPLSVAVNVSPRQFQQGDVLKTVVDVLEETGLDPHRLGLEITETLLMQNAENTRTAMRELSALGVKFSIDDFGTGYSSLAYLKHLPIGHVKIDRSFVRDIPADGNDAAIVAAILSMARSLGIRVIAEGVETKEQLDFLGAHGCDAAQGYYFSRPLPMHTLALILADRTAVAPRVTGSGVDSGSRGK